MIRLFPVKKSSNPLKNRKLNRSGFLFVLPWVIGFLVFTLGPMLYSLVLSFFKWEFFQNLRFVGFENYIRIFTEDRFAMPGLLKTLKFTAISVPFQLTVSLLIAMLLNSKVKGKGLVRVLVFVPVVLSGAVAGQMWKFMYHDDLGVFNYFLSFIGAQVNWITDSSIALYSVALTGLWAVGIPMVLFLAALKTVPKTLYEAADIDGTNKFQKFFKVTLPHLTPTILYNLIQIMIVQFQCLSPFMIITGGGPADSTYVYSLYEFETAFKYLRMGYASALSWVMLFVILTATLIIMKTSKLWVYYETERD
ncbi:MAG: sugar ABC transporter permease [Clostridia bacterium]|nr:sugar ABC transporter permease [Clostridia bacterium]